MGYVLIEGGYGVLYLQFRPLEVVEITMSCPNPRGAVVVLPWTERESERESRKGRETLRERELELEFQTVQVQKLLQAKHIQKYHTYYKPKNKPLFLKTLHNTPSLINFEWFFSWCSWCRSCTWSTPPF